MTLTRILMFVEVLFGMFRKMFLVKFILVNLLTVDVEEVSGGTEAEIETFS